MDLVCVIPARLKSSRLPHKPLLDICGKTMLERTFNRARAVFDSSEVFIATDSELIKNSAESYTDNIIITSSECKTGTDRIAEFSKIIEAKAYINLQGDEPIMPIKNIEIIKEHALLDPELILNGFAKIDHQDDYFSRTIPKVVFDNSNKLLYMSRSPVPGNKSGTFQISHKQICVYSFPRKILKYYGPLEKKSANEAIEDIEIMRLIDAGQSVQMLEMSENTVAVDTLADLERVRLIIEMQGEDRPEYDCS